MQVRQPHKINLAGIQLIKIVAHTPDGNVSITLYLHQNTEEKLFINRYEQILVGFWGNYASEKELKS